MCESRGRSLYDVRLPQGEGRIAADAVYTRGADCTQEVPIGCILQPSGASSCIISAHLVRERQPDPRKQRLWCLEKQPAAVTLPDSKGDGGQVAQISLKRAGTLPVLPAWGKSCQVGGCFGVLLGPPRRHNHRLRAGQARRVKLIR